METFTPNRALLNPKFDGYKLDPISQDDAVTRYPLQCKPTQATVSGKSTFSFQEVQSRITHNHIAVWNETGRALYVDSESRVVLIDIDARNVAPHIRVIYELPSQVVSSGVDPRNHEYPSAAFLTETTVFVSDGHGIMYVLQIKEDGPSESLGVFTLGELESTPFKIHSVHRTAPTTVIAILSSRHYSNGFEPQVPLQTRGSLPPTDFDVSAAKIELLSLRPQADARQLDLLWRRRGQDVPIYTAYNESLNSFLLIGGTSYRETSDPLLAPYEPTPDELVPIPRAEENFVSEIAEPPKPPSYSWTQTNDSVTVAFPLPSSTPKSRINVSFSPKTVTLHIENEVPTSVPIPHYSAKPLWDGISSSSSYWTWDREAEHSFGLLTLHLDKQHEGTKWSHVFASVGTSSTLNNSEDMEVPETLDPSELWHIREALEKYTTALRDGDDSSGLGLGRGVPSLAEGEIDMEVDESVGRTAYTTWVDGDGSTPSRSGSNQVPFQLLSTPMPGSRSSDLSLIVKTNLDGALYMLSPLNTIEESPRWTHTSTFSALSFVLASKQDTRFTHHINGKAVFAFEGGVRDRGGNVYIYRASPIGKNQAKQAILKVGDGYGGSLLGVGTVQVREAGAVLVCLTEGELILIRNL